MPLQSLTNAALQEALQVTMKEQLVRALGKTLSNTWNVNAYSVSAGQPTDVARVQSSDASLTTALPEELFSIEEDEQPSAGQQEQASTDDSSAPHMRFLSANDRKQQQKQVEGRRRVSLGGQTPPPAEFFCPISHCLMMEPVKILNTGVTINRTSAQAWMRTRSQVCPVTGQPLRGWVAMESNDDLRERIEQWVAGQGINISLLENAAIMMYDLCAQVAH